jgi:hypothetical protein
VKLILKLDLSYQQGFDSAGMAEQATLGKYFNFLLLNVHFVFLLCTTVWDSSSNFFLNPVAWTENIASSIPTGF